MKINKQELINALEKVKPGLANKEMIEQSTSFAFINGRVVTYNDEISISHPVTDLDLEGAVQATKLYQFLNKIKADEVVGEVKGAEIQLTAGKSKAGLALQAEVKLPLDEMGKIGKWYDLPEGFLAALNFTSFSCSSDMSKPVLTCIHVRKDLGQMESSNNLRATVMSLNGDLPVPSFLIPASSARILCRYDVKQVARGKGWIHFLTEDDTIFSCRIFEDHFPEMMHLFDISGTEITLPKNISEILEKAGVFSSKDHFLDDMVEVTLADKKLLIRASDGADWFEEEANIRYTDKPVTFSIHTNFLKEICSRTNTCILGTPKAAGKGKTQKAGMLGFQGEGWQHVLCLSVK